MTQVVREAIETRLKASRELENNREEFITYLKEKVTEPARNSGFTDQRLWNGVCDDCKHLKDKLESLTK